jgi:hypothetical protein
MAIVLDIPDVSIQLVPFIVGNVIQDMMEIKELDAGLPFVLLIKVTQNF